MKRYADDYETVIKVDDNGNEKKTAEYRGEYIGISLDDEGLQKYKRNCIVLVAAIALLHIAAGFINNRGMFQFYIALPYAVAFFPLLYLAAAVLRIPRWKPQYRRDEIGLSFDRTKKSSIIFLIILVSSVLGEIYYLLVGSSEFQFMQEMLFLILELSALLGIYLINRQRSGIQIHNSVIK